MQDFTIFRKKSGDTTLGTPSAKHVPILLNGRLPVAERERERERIYLPKNNNTKRKRRKKFEGNRLMQGYLKNDDRYNRSDRD